MSHKPHKPDAYEVRPDGAGYRVYELPDTPTIYYSTDYDTVAYQAERLNAQRQMWSMRGRNRALVAVQEKYRNKGREDVFYVFPV